MQLKNLLNGLIHVMVSQIHNKLFFQDVCYYTGTYSQVPNKQVGQNKRVVWLF